MKPDHQRVHELFARYLEGRLSDVEKNEFWGYVADPLFGSVFKQLLSQGFENEKESGVLDEQAQRRILTHIYTRDTPVIQTKRFNWISYAAAVAFMVLVGSWFFLHDQIGKRHDQLVQLSDEDIKPGGNHAILKLADGRTLLLNEDQSGIVLSGEQITYEDGNPLINLHAEGQPGESAPWLELTTPRGGTYQLTLPDGTNVWLNAGSVLRYPIRFDRERRVVELSGEAYFDVAQLEVKNRKVPFMVKTNVQAVEVLGTQFNLSAYTDDMDVKTTLVEGSVRITSATDQYTPLLLKPSQQSVSDGEKVVINTVDVRPFVAWKEGYFHFKNTPFTEVIIQVARWYDIDFAYKGEAPAETFSGKISRNISLQALLKFFEGSEIQFTLVGGKLIIGQ